MCGTSNGSLTRGLILSLWQNARVRITRLLAVWVKREGPDAAKEAHHATDAARRPGAALIPRAHEHQEEAHRVGAMLADELVGVLHVAARLRHALAVGAEDLPLIEEARERLGFTDQSKVAHRLGKEARVEQMHHGMFGTAGVLINWAPGIHEFSINRPTFVLW